MIGLQNLASCANVAQFLTSNLLESLSVRDHSLTIYSHFRKPPSLADHNSRIGTASRVQWDRVHSAKDQGDGSSRVRVSECQNCEPRRSWFTPANVVDVTNSATFLNPSATANIHHWKKGQFIVLNSYVATPPQSQLIEKRQRPCCVREKGSDTSSKALILCEAGNGRRSIEKRQE